MSKKLDTQYFGRITHGSKSYDAMLCIDENRPLEATIHWWDDTLSIRGAASVILRPENNARYKVTPLALFDTFETGSLRPSPSEEAQTCLAKHTAFLDETENTLTGQWGTSGEICGDILLSTSIERYSVNLPTSLPKLSPHTCNTWKDFKDWADSSRTTLRATCFRGQGDNRFRLKSTFHRAGLNRLEIYCLNALQQFRYQVETLLDTRININDGDDYAMLLGLAQHHGMPSPLLDWTGSPYIAAYFAFADALERSRQNDPPTFVRVFGLTRDFIDNHSPSSVSVPFYKPYVVVLRVPGRKNPRLYAQQGQFLVSNVADVEPFLQVAAHRLSRACLVAADIPAECAYEALQDLRYMGLSAASMFPGLDGICRMMKHSMLFPPQT